MQMTNYVQFCRVGGREGLREGGIKGGRGKVAVGVACCEQSEHSH